MLVPQLLGFWRRTHLAVDPSGGGATRVVINQLDPALSKRQAAVFLLLLLTWYRNPYRCSENLKKIN
jgi:hypothetical protein